MNQTAIFWPMIIHAALVFVVYFYLSNRRIAAVKGGSAKSSQFRENIVEPPESQFVRNNIANQFELPTLFYPVCLALFVTNGVGMTVLILAWLFVLSRIAHAWIHVTSNRIRYRRPLFVLGFFAMAGLWLAFTAHLAIG